MKKFIQHLAVVILLISFTAVILRVSTNSFLSAEEELVEHGSGLVEKKSDVHNFNPFEVFGAVQYIAAPLCHLASKTKNSKDYWLNYQDPCLDIPLLPPEIKA